MPSLPRPLLDSPLMGPKGGRGKGKKKSKNKNEGGKANDAAASPALTYEGLKKMFEDQKAAEEAKTKQSEEAQPSDAATSNNGSGETAAPWLSAEALEIAMQRVAELERELKISKSR